MARRGSECTAALRNLSQFDETSENLERGPMLDRNGSALISLSLAGSSPGEGRPQQVYYDGSRRCGS